MVYCLVDLKQDIPTFAKSRDRLRALAASLIAEPSAIDEHDEVPSNKACYNKYLFYRTPGYVSALKSQGLVDFLAQRRIQSLLLYRLTSGCVLSTARAACHEGFIVTVIADACKDPVPGLHDSLVHYVLPMQAHRRYGGRVLVTMEQVNLTKHYQSSRLPPSLLV